MDKMHDTAPDSRAVDQNEDPWEDDDNLVRAFTFVYHQLQNPATKHEAPRRLWAVRRRYELEKDEYGRLQNLRESDLTAINTLNANLRALQSERDQLKGRLAETGKKRPDSQSEILKQALAVIDRQSKVLSRLQGAVTALERERDDLRRELQHTQQRNADRRSGQEQSQRENMRWMQAQFRELLEKYHHLVMTGAITAQEASRALREVTRADSTAWAQIERQLDDS